MQLCSNWAFTDHMPEPVCAPVDFISGDYSPEDSVNSARLSARYMARQGKPWDLMAWSFTRNRARTGKPEDGRSIAARGRRGARPGRRLPGVLHPKTGRLDPRGTVPVMAEVAAFCRARQAICHHAQAVPQVALLYSTAAHYRQVNGLFARDLSRLQGTLQALLECQQSVEVLGEHHLVGRMAEYPLIVAPECDYLEPAFRDELLAYVRGGGSLLLIGPRTAALFQAELGVTLEGKPQSEPRYLAIAGGMMATKGPTQAARLGPKAQPFGRTPRHPGRQLRLPTGRVDHAAGPRPNSCHVLRLQPRVSQRSLGDGTSLLEHPGKAALPQAPGRGEGLAGCGRDGQPAGWQAGGESRQHGRSARGHPRPDHRRDPARWSARYHDPHEEEALADHIGAWGPGLALWPPQRRGATDSAQSGDPQCPPRGVTHELAAGSLSGCSPEGEGAG